MTTTVDIHRKIVTELTKTYEKKNKDYGDSFGKSIEKHGLIASVVRMEDKLNRFANLISKDTKEVEDESLEDTLLDLANYAIMTVIEMRYPTVGDETLIYSADGEYCSINDIGVVDNDGL